MLLSAHHPVSCFYRVEVSGWDFNEAFFVEKSELSWDEEAGKHVGLSHMLHDGSVVFVRLLQPAAVERSYPVAYMAEYVGSATDGHYQFRLNQMHPRMSENEMAVH